MDENANAPPATGQRKAGLGEAMRKLRIIEHVSLDGVIQAPGGKGEDGDYPYSGWSAPFNDPELGKAIVAAHSQPFDLLLGRRTYDIWSGYWPKAEGPFAKGINAATKYIATYRPDTLKWGPAEAVGPDIAEGVRRIKAGNGPDLILWGSSTLTPALIEHGLADEVMLLTYPVLLGKGKRFFSDGTPARELALVSSKAGSSGVIVNIYKPGGPLRSGEHS
jgi:dihydrofolate reductase